MHRKPKPASNPARRRKSTPARPKLPPSRRDDGRARGPVDALALWGSITAGERLAFLERLPASASDLDDESLEFYAALAYASSRGHRVAIARGVRIDMPQRFTTGDPPCVAAGAEAGS